MPVFPYGPWQSSPTHRHPNTLLSQKSFAAELNPHLSTENNPSKYPKSKREKAIIVLSGCPAQLKPPKATTLLCFGSVLSWESQKKKPSKRRQQAKFRCLHLSFCFNSYPPILVLFDWVIEIWTWVALLLVTKPLSQEISRIKVSPQIFHLHRIYNLLVLIFHPLQYQELCPFPPL